MKIFLYGDVMVKKSEATYQGHPSVPRLLLVIFPQSSMIMAFIQACEQMWEYFNEYQREIESNL